MFTSSPADFDGGGTHDASAPRSAEPAFFRKLTGACMPTSLERAAMLKVLGANVRTLSGRTALVEQGSAAHEVHVILSGWACRYATRDGGRRQIVAFYLPGDICEPSAFDLGPLDQTIAAVNGVQVAGIGRTTFEVLARGCPRFARAVWRETLAAAAIQRRWTINVARRSARERVSHLICELIARLEVVGTPGDGRYYWPINQADLADACGMTVEHANRTLQALRADGLLSLRDQSLTVHEREALHLLASFNPAYLQVA